MLTGIEYLRIFGDNDRSETGQRKSLECQARWLAAGRHAVVELPPDPGQDFDDLLLKLATERTTA